MDSTKPSLQGKAGTHTHTHTHVIYSGLKLIPNYLNLTAKLSSLTSSTHTVPHFQIRGFPYTHLYIIDELAYIHLYIIDDRAYRGITRVTM